MRPCFRPKSIPAFPRVPRRDEIGTLKPLSLPHVEPIATIRRLRAMLKA